MSSRLACLVALLALPAAASSEYPIAVQMHLSLMRPPPQSCALCHTNGITGAGTVNTPFGRAARMQGLVGGGNTASLIAALDALDAAGTDSDSDGVSDINELRAGTNPNVANAMPDGGTGGGGGGTGGGAGGGGDIVEIPPPRFGCGASVMPGLLAGAALLLLRRRRR
jgi:hypothetical protein